MFDDTIADFWKDKMVKIQKQNMARKDAERLPLIEAQNCFNEFAAKHPDFPAVTAVSSSYATWEINLTEELKLRLFIQNQIKATFLQKNGADYIKLADARFLNNPFPEIEQFIERLPEHLSTLQGQQLESLHNSRYMKVARHFITAFLQEKYEGSDILWKIEEAGKAFKIKLSHNGDEKLIEVNALDFIEKLSTDA